MTPPVEVTGPDVGGTVTAVEVRPGKGEEGLDVSLDIGPPSLIYCLGEILFGALGPPFLLSCDF